MRSIHEGVNMAFTQAQLNAELTAPEQVIAFCNNAAGTYTDVYCQNMYSTAKKAGWTQIAQTQTAAQAAAAIRANLS